VSAVPSLSGRTGLYGTLILCCLSYVQIRTACPWLELRPLLAASTNTSANPGMKVGGPGRVWGLSVRTHGATHTRHC
jgi:hypothetical protein